MPIFPLVLCRLQWFRQLLTKKRPVRHVVPVPYVKYDMLASIYYTNMYERLIVHKLWVDDMEHWRAILRWSNLDSFLYHLKDIWYKLLAHVERFRIQWFLVWELKCHEVWRTVSKLKKSTYFRLQIVTIKDRNSIKNYDKDTIKKQ